MFHTMSKTDVVKYLVSKGENKNEQLEASNELQGKFPPFNPKETYVS